jgi:ATP adenylyltransferase
VFHAHWHLIPRRNGDHEQPRGGVRSVIPEKKDY